jgi:cytochrome bd-type quinol oxidase subunit 2
MTVGAQKRARPTVKRVGMLFVWVWGLVGGALIFFLAAWAAGQLSDTWWAWAGVACAVLSPGVAWAWWRRRRDERASQKRLGWAEWIASTLRREEAGAP